MHAINQGCLSGGCLFGESEVEGVEGLELEVKESEGFEKEEGLRQCLNKVTGWKKGKLREVFRSKRR